MSPDEIRSTTKFETGGLNKQDAIDNAQAFWLREIAAQLAEIATYMLRLSTGMANVNAQLDAIRAFEIRMSEQKSKAKSPVPAGGGKRGGD